MESKKLLFQNYRSVLVTLAPCWLLLPVLVCSITSVFAQVTVVTDQANANYTAGQQMHFEVNSFSTGPATYTIYYDRFNQAIQTGNININAGTSTHIPFTLNEPGVALCRVEQFGQQSISSAVFSASDIDAFEAEPADFDQFWNQLKGELAAVPLNPQLTFYSGSAYSTTYRMSLGHIEGRRVYGYISIPAGPGPFPAVIGLPSFGSTPNVVTPDDFLAERGGAISVTVNIHNAPADQTDPFAYQPDDLTDRQQIYMKYAVLAAVRAIDYVFTMPSFDGTNVAVNGVSQGGGLALMVAGIDQRVKLLVQSNASHCQHLGLKYERASGFPYYIDRSRTTVGTPAHEQATAQNVKYYDAIYFAKRFKGPSLSVISYEDDVCPAATVFAAHNQLTGPKILLNARELGHNHPNEYWSGRFDFYREHFSSMRTPPWPWPETTRGFVVDAGADTNADQGVDITLNGLVTKEGQIINNPTVKWEKVSGPGTINFGTPGNLTTTANFDTPGDYVLRMTVYDYDKLNTEAKFYTLTDLVEVEVSGGSNPDNIPPSVALSTPNNQVTGSFQVTARLSESVQGLGADDVTIINGTISNFSGSGRVFQFTITPTSPGQVRIRIAANRFTDLANNFNTPSNELIVQYDLPDTQAPTITLSTLATTVNDAFTVNISISEQVLGFAVNDIIVTNGTKSGFSGNGSTYSITITPSNQGVVRVVVPANSCQDQAGNANEISNELVINYVIPDTDRPLPRLRTGATNVTGPFQIELVLNENVTGLGLDDFTVSNAALSNLTGGGTSYFVTANPTDAGTVRISIPANRFTDVAGNGNLVSNELIVQYNVPDTQAPTAELSTASAIVNGAFVVQLRLSEQSNGLEPGDLTITNAVLSNWNGSGLDYSFTLTPQNEGNVSAVVRSGTFVDLASNQNLASNILNVTYQIQDTQAPTATLSTIASIVNGLFTVQLRLSEEPVGLEPGDLTVNNAILSDWSGSGLNYTFTLTPQVAGSVTAVVRSGTFADLAGNQNLASNILNIEYELLDTQAPIVVLSTNVDTIDGPFEIDVVLSESIGRDLAIDDITTNNAAVINITGSGLNYTLLIDPGAPGLTRIWIEAGKLEDQAGNQNASSNIIEVFYKPILTQQPILFISGTLQNREAVIEWANNTGYKNERYVIEHSTDSINFELLNIQTNSDKTDELVTYKYIDQEPEQGSNYYRVWVDFEDGSRLLSDVVKIEVEYDVQELVVFPNPATGQFWVHALEFEGQKATLFLYDAHGDILRTYEYDALPSKPINFQLENYPPGVYQLQFVIKGESVFTRQLVVM